MPRTKTIAELRRELAAKERKLKTLSAKRSTLRVQLSAIDREIAKLGGEGTPGKKGKAKPTPKRRKMVKNKRSLGNVLAEVAKGRKLLGVADAAKLVLAKGYKSQAKNFHLAVNKTLMKDKRFGRVGRGIYTLKGQQGGIPKKRKKAARKSRAAKKG